jgi:hemerythrin
VQKQTLTLVSIRLFGGNDMPDIEWDESFSVKNAKIDEQHKRWIEVYNKLHESMLRDDYEELKKNTEDSLRAMEDYTRYHFNFEEEYLQKINYPDLVKRVRMHKDFDTLIYECCRDMRKGTMFLKTRLLKIIKNWLLDHILSEDKKYSLFAAEVEKTNNDKSD